MDVEALDVVGDVIESRRLSPVLDCTSPGIVSLSTLVSPSSCSFRLLDIRFKSVSVNLKTDWRTPYK